MLKLYAFRSEWWMGVVFGGKLSPYSSRTCFGAERDIQLNHCRCPKRGDHERERKIMRENVTPLVS